MSGDIPQAIRDLLVGHQFEDEGTDAHALAQVAELVGLTVVRAAHGFLMSIQEAGSSPVWSRQAGVTETGNLKDACTTDPHDRGMVIVAGVTIAGEPIGQVYWDTAGDGGYVLRIGEHEYLPDNADDVTAKLANHGWRLTPESRAEVVALQPGEEE